ncbi:MAG: transporter permease [Pseudonocardiales bacterium]|nr:transporter permease [Jatrophihabitantaceae bacterium]MCW2601894.1 transporter permease [Pseudonocardiales bacterium]
MSLVGELRTSQDLLLNLTKREITGKYKRTALGQAWSLVNPLAQMAIYSLVFGFVLQNNVGPAHPSGLHVFALWLSAALLPWIFFTNVMTSGMAAILSNSNLVKKVYFPRYTLVVSSTLSWLFTFAIEISVLIVVVLIFGGMPLLYLPGIVIAMILLATLGLGLGFMLAVANVYFRDTSHFISILVQVWFYATPIVYPLTLIEGKARDHPGWHILTIYRMNPMERFSEVFRAFIYENRMPPTATVLYVIVVPVVVLVLGFAIFQRFEGAMAEEL